MVNGQPDGYWKTYFDDGGMKSEGNRKNLLLDSVWKFYRTDSTLERTITYAELHKIYIQQEEGSYQSNL
jgi:antitoxin component YwqK of YwqJK toxin-antitoxin module